MPRSDKHSDKPAESSWEGLKPGIYRDLLVPGVKYRLEHLNAPNKGKRATWTVTRLEQQQELTFYPYLVPDEEAIQVKVETQPVREKNPQANGGLLDV